MTDKQRSRFYFPAWGAAAKVHGWLTRSSLTRAARLEVWGSPEVSALYGRVWDFAERQMAQRIKGGFRGEPEPDDFRHGCHVVALGKDKSTNDLTAAECDRVVALFRLLADPDDLRAMMAWNSPQEARRKRMLWWIRKQCVESYVVAVCREKFGTDEPAALNDAQLRQLHMTLKNRPAALRQAIGEPF